MVYAERRGIRGQSGAMIQLMTKLPGKFQLWMEKADVRALLCSV